MKKLQAIKPDNLRPYTRFAQVKDGRVIITNGALLTVQPAKEVFGQDLPTDAHFYFETKHWGDAKLHTAKIIAVENGTIRNISNGLKIDTLSPEKYANVYGRYPDWPVVLPVDREPAGISFIGLDPELCLQAINALGVSPEKVRFTFFGEDKGFILEAFGTEGFALIMPCKILGELTGGYFNRYLKPTEPTITESDSLEPGDL